MIIEVRKGHEQTVEHIKELAREVGVFVDIIHGRGISDTLHIIGDARPLFARQDYILELPGVVNCWRITCDYKNIARVVEGGNGNVVERERRTVCIPGPDGYVRKVGNAPHLFIVGPCTVQTREQVLSIARAARKIGEEFGIVDRIMLRGGAYKPRTRPTDFRGLGMDGIKLMDEAREETGLPYVSEVMDHNLVEELAQHVDMFQIGTRHAQDFDLLEAVGRSGKPVLLKRGFGNEAAEWFSAAEYVANQGNLNIVLCERGVKTLFAKEGYCRNTPDFNVIRYAREKTILPVIFDPSHAAGSDRIVCDNLLAAMAFQADGSITETIHEEAFRKHQLCDARQALLMDLYREVVEAMLKFEQLITPHLRTIDAYFASRK
ncbi:MAG: 3-deoxy-D-arabino-heptulosonate 7-phosphate synthase [Candidatus Tectimicrobiota bacterium]|nr:MAG: 3-deoxy-D-arabino-heptulosonate 7-phosphate synthase [Candidatus Tectomicrobia bacterium]